MILFLIELYVSGFSIAALFRNKLPDSFLSLISVFFGLFAYFVNVFLLTLFNIHITKPLVVILSGIEIIIMCGYSFYQSPPKPKLSHLFYLLSGSLFVLLSWYFLNNVYIYASPDSLYMIVMAESILETGFSQWYFTSPLHWGPFIPILQTIGMLFGYDYTWFIQPVISFIFLGIFAVVLHRASSRLTSKKWLPTLLSLMGAGLMLTTNLYWISQFYLHNNLTTAIALFLTVAPFYLAVTENNKYWLGVTTIFLIILGLLRIENVIISSLFIVLAVSSRKLDHKTMLWTFLPYLIIQIGWNLLVLWLKPVAFGNLITLHQLLIVTVSLVVLISFLLISKLDWIKQTILPFIPWITYIGLILGLAVLSFIEPDKTLMNFSTNLTTMFITGKWRMTWLVIWLVLIFSHSKNKVALRNLLNLLIFGFFSMIPILGFFRNYYHTLWYDSANRIMLHIVPVIIFYLVLRLGTKYSKELISDY